jgi:hypothetical protein
MHVRLSNPFLNSFCCCCVASHAMAGPGAVGSASRASDPSSCCMCCLILQVQSNRAAVGSVMSRDARDVHHIPAYRIDTADGWLPQADARAVQSSCMTGLCIGAIYMLAETCWNTAAAWQQNCCMLHATHQAAVAYCTVPHNNSCCLTCHAVLLLPAALAL